VLDRGGGLAQALSRGRGGERAGGRVERGTPARGGRACTELEAAGLKAAR